jgi:outer membrane protein assembly factor BamB
MTTATEATDRCSHLLVCGDVVVVWRCGGAVGFRLRDGRKLWERAGSFVDMAADEPGADDAQGVRLYAAYRTDGEARGAGPLAIAAWRANDGTPCWSWKGRGFRATVRHRTGGPVLAVISAWSDEGPYRLQALDAGTGQAQWGREVPEAHWTAYPTHDQFDYQDGRLVYANDTALTIISYGADGHVTHAESHRYDGQCIQGLVLTPARLYVPGMFNVQCLDTRTGQTAWRAEGMKVGGLLAVAEGRLVAFDWTTGLLGVFELPAESAPPEVEVAPPTVGVVPSDLSDRLHGGGVSDLR